MQYHNGKLYFGNRGHKGSSWSPYKIDGRGRRFLIQMNGQSYYIEIKLKEYGGYYDNLESRKVVAGYEYNLYSLDYVKLCQLLEYQYPTSDLSALYSHSSTIDISIDALMIIKKRNSDGTYRHLGGISNHNRGRVSTWGNVYRTEKEMSDAWHYYTGGYLDFTGFYGVHITIPGITKPSFIDTTKIELSGDSSACHQVNTNTYYVRANKNFSLSYSSISAFMTTGCQINKSYFDVKDSTDGRVIMTNNYIYSPNNSNGGINYNGSNQEIKFYGATATRSDTNKILQVATQCKMLEDGVDYTIYPRAQVTLESSHQVLMETPIFPKGKEMRVISDGRGPVIEDQSDATTNDGYWNLVFKVKDLGVGLKLVELQDKNNNTIVTSKTEYLSYAVTESGDYYVVSEDLVGNVSAYKKSIIVVSLPEKEVVELRFISPEYSFQPERLGGLKTNSVWRNKRNWLYLHIIMKRL